MWLGILNDLNIDDTAEIRPDELSASLWLHCCQTQASGVCLQDPAQADKLTKIQRDLDETKIILHKTIESVLDRGEKLDQVR